MSQHHQDESLAWLDIVDAYETVYALLNQELTKSGFTFSQYRVIRFLGKYGEGLETVRATVQQKRRNRT